ncbi:MAG: GAF domain-containing protein [Deltaproteobacteria bacterium]|nr:GAF domain-containing protein [Deltaproteobacteria bacterium]
MPTDWTALSTRYAEALREYVTAPGESILELAYELGRSAAASGIGVLEMVTIHEQAQGGLLASLVPAIPLEEVLSRASLFFRESLAPFEITHRGYRESHAALQRLNAELELRAAKLAAASESVRRLTRERSAFLAEASRQLASSLNYDVTAKSVAQVAVPRIADVAILDILEQRNAARRAVVARVDPGLSPLCEELEKYPPKMEAATGASKVLKSGVSELVTNVDPSYLASIAQDPAHLACLQKLQVRSLMVVPLSAGGRVKGALTLMSRSPERRYGVDELDLAEDLAQRACLALENARLLLEANEAVQLRDEFLAIASHELYTPITTLQLSVQNLRRLLDRPEVTPPERLRKILMAIEKQGKRLAGMVDNLLDVSRMHHGKLVLQVGEVDLLEVVLAVVGNLSEELSRAGCVLSIDAKEKVFGRWDRMRLEQVVTNLLTNAIKFGAGKPIEISLQVPGGTARLTMTDHGVGIPAERIPFVFDRFERAVSLWKYGGLGLGLYIVRQVLEAHGGRVTVASEPGVSTTFVVELPCEQAPAARSEGNY